MSEMKMEIERPSAIGEVRKGEKLIFGCLQSWDLIQVVNLIARGNLIKTLANPSAEYKGQKLFPVRRGKAVYAVPFEKRTGKVPAH